MKLYYSPNACSLSPHIVLRECNLSFDMEKVDLTKKILENGDDFLKINPKGYVPVLITDNNQVLTEGPAIIQYIADLKPNLNMIPSRETFERYRLQEWLNFIATEVHKVFGPLFKENTPAEYKNIIKENLTKKFAYLEKHLAKNNFLMGNTYSIADTYLFTVLRWSHFLKIDLKPWPSLIQFLETINKRPAVQAALKAEEMNKKS